MYSESASLANPARSRLCSQGKKASAPQDPQYWVTQPAVAESSLRFDQDKILVMPQLKGSQAILDKHRPLKTDSSTLSQSFKGKNHILPVLPKLEEDTANEQVMQSPEVLRDLKNAMVLCQDGEKRKLCQTILPTKETISAGRLFGVAERLPYLQMDSESDVVTTGDWSFLQTFEVCLKPTLRFHLDALENLSEPSGVSSQVKEHALAIYRGIISVATLNDKEMLKVRHPPYSQA